MEMIKGIKGHGYYDELVIPIIENTAFESELTESLAKAVCFILHFTLLIDSIAHSSQVVDGTLCFVRGKKKRKKKNRYEDSIYAKLNPII